MEEFGDGVESVTKVEWKENPKQRVEAEDDRAPFDEQGNGSKAIGRAHHADQVMAGDVRSDDAAADHPPRQLVAGQEVVALGFGPAPRRIEPHAEDRDHVEDENAQVEGG